MTNRSNDPSQTPVPAKMTNRCNDPPPAPVAEEAGVPPHAPGPQAQQDQLHSRSGNKVFRSGPLFLSSKGIGWTSWKKRWFVLTRTSLVFFRNDPNAVPQKGGEVKLTLGGIDLNNSGSVVVKADKKLLTVLFPDGGQGRAFTLKAETLEDLYEWKAALEEALAQAPCPTIVMGQNPIFRNDQADTCDESAEQTTENQPVKSLVIGRPVLLALEDVDGTPSFLEKALRFVEEHGVKVEGILRQAAYVDDVERRIREYEQGKTDFSSGEDAHVIADCVKYILRELPSSPVPASCCNALVEACKTDRGRRVAAMREAICETFPEPNRRLLQRILQMMQIVTSHKAENRMNSSAVAACMAPLLLRPLLAGDCELEHDFDVGGDGSFQLLQAAAAANHAQAIVVTLLEEYDKIFGEGTMSSELYSDTDESEEFSDDDYYSTDDEEDEDGTTEGSEVDVDEDLEHASNDSHNENSETGDDDLRDDKGCEDPGSDSKANESDNDHKAKEKSSSESKSLPTQHDNSHEKENNPSQRNNDSIITTNKSGELLGEPPIDVSSAHKSDDNSPSSHVNGPVRGARRQAVWGRAHGKKNLSMESIDVPFEDEAEIEKLEVTKNDLRNRIAEEAKGNAVLQESLERRKKALQERRRALEQDVAKLQEQLQKERDLRIALEAGLTMPKSLPIPPARNEKVKVELEKVAQVEGSVSNLKQTADSPGVQLNQHHERNQGAAHTRNRSLETAKNKEKPKEREESKITATSHIPPRSTSKDVQLEQANSDKDARRENPGLASQSISQNQLPIAAQNSPPVGITGSSSFPAELAVGLSTPTPSKKYTNRGEGNTTASSALSKLTNRLNFLKERRNMLAGEIQTLDKDQSSRLSVQKEDSNRQLANNLETNSGGDKGRSGGGQSAINLEKGNLDSFPKAEKGRRSEGKHERINSR